MRPVIIVGIIALLGLSCLPAFAQDKGKYAAVINAADYPDLQAAVDAVPYPGGIVNLAPGAYTLKKPLNLADTYNSGQKTRWLTLQGSGKSNTSIIGDFPEQPLVDATCAGYLTIRDITFAGKCKTLWLSARRKGAGGGGNVFENCIFRGDFAPVTMWLIGSECNRFINSEIYNSTTNGVCVAFLPVKQFTARGVTYNIESPYVGPDMTGSSTTELRFYGCFIHSWGLNSIGLYAQGSTADISISGGYNSNCGFASIYLDGTKANVGDSAFRDLRIEGETGLYCLYATGSVRNVTIDSGNWGSAGEVIRYEGATSGFAANSGAEGWSIHNLSLTIQDQSVRAPEKTGALCKLPRDQRAILRLDRMANCQIENIWVRAYQIIRVPKTTPAPADDKDHGTVIQNQAFTTEEKLEYYPAKLLICSEWARSCTIQTGSSKDVVLPAGAQGNRIEALYDDGGVRRTYYSGGVQPDVLNFAPIDVRTIASPRVGDVAMDNGKLRGDGVPCLAYYTGKAWVPCGAPATK
ncbi:MAG TPA: hypothetical protein VGM23_10175 [Armatimonadota bacterium]